MPHAPPRFECKREPSGTWMVWDNKRDSPASLGGFVLRGQEKARARTACDLLTKIFHNRLEARDVGEDVQLPE